MNTRASPNVIRKYEEFNRPAEYLARIPHVMATLALGYPEYDATRIEEIMEKSIPNLYHFFVNDFIPACKAYLH
jgi:hypothetical protein